MNLPDEILKQLAIADRQAWHNDPEMLDWDDLIPDIQQRYLSSAQAVVDKLMELI